MNRIMEPETNWIDLGKVIIYIIAPFLLVWKFIDRYFKERSEERAEFIKLVVKEVLESSVEPIKTQITRLEEHYDRGFDKVHGRIDKLFEEIKK